MIKIGCSGFPVSKRLYASRFNVVELIDAQKRSPRAATLVKWRAEAPTQFEYVVVASNAITHHTSRGFHTVSSAAAMGAARRGRFQATAEVRHAVGQTVEMARALDARLILFALPPALTAHPDTIGRVHKFFEQTDRGGQLFVWEPPASWPRTLVDSISKAFRLTVAVNPLAQRPHDSDGMRYFRLGDAKRTRGVYTYTGPELRDIRRACDKPLSYVFFNNGPTAFGDAERLLGMA